jgi:tetratricopeptide (TPR) repeat protein
MDNETSTPIVEENKRLSTNKSEIEMSKTIWMNKDCKNEFGKVYVKSEESNKKVDITCKVNFFLQKYICSEDNLYLTDRNYKNELSEKISDMTAKKSLLREMLIGLKRDEIVWCFFDKKNDETLYKEMIKNSKIVDKEFDGVIYYKIIIKQIIFKTPDIPNSTNKLGTYFSTILDNVRYYFQSNNYSEAIKLCNSAIKCLFEMNKELKKNLTAKLNEEFKVIVKNIISNKTLCLFKKPNDSKLKDYEEIVNCVNNEYEKNYKDQNDQIDRKILYRKGISLEKLKRIDECVDFLSNVSKKYPNDEEIKSLYESVLKLKGTSKTSLFKFKPLSSIDINTEQDYEWDDEVESLNLDYDIGESELVLLNNL